MNRPLISKHRNNQRGATLIIAMIMLLLLTIIGLSSMRGTSLQESMAGNMRDSSLAQHAAEAALRQGEAVVTEKFIANTLTTLEAASQTGTYDGFYGVAEAPDYRITLLANLRTNTAAGEPLDDEGALVRVEGDGYGMQLDQDGNVISHVELRSVFLVEQ